jgi:collagenase-like PrtC family protease
MPTRATPAPGSAQWTSAAELGADALIVADSAVLAYARRPPSELRLHLSVQASATTYEAIEFYRERYGIQPRGAAARAHAAAGAPTSSSHTPVDIEVFGFGSLCVMVEGRCALSSYVTGQSPNTAGVCSPPSAVRWEEQSDGGVEARLNGVLIDRYAPTNRAATPRCARAASMSKASATMRSRSPPA